MSELSLKELCERCHIACSKCLDTGKLWKPRDHPFAQLDLKGAYDVIRCNSCSDGSWLHCSHTNIINESGIRLFHKDDDNDASRISVVNDIYYKLLENHKRIKEQIEKDRLIKLQREREDRDREENERLRKLQREREDQERYENEVLAKLQRHREEQEQQEQERLRRLQREQEEQSLLEKERLRKLQREQEEKDMIENERLKNLQREREENERLENERIAKLKREQEEKDLIEQERIHQEELKQQIEKRKKDSIDQQMNDGSDQPLYGESIDDSCSTTTEHIHIQGELGKLIDKVSTAIQAANGDLISLASAVKDIKIDLDMKSEDETIEKTKCCQSTKKDGFPVYLFLKVRIHNESSSCKLLEWCGCSNIVSKITVKYMVLFPKNKVAKKECDDGISAITGVKLDGIITFLKT